MGYEGSWVLRDRVKMDLKNHGKFVKKLGDCRMIVNDIMDIAVD